jgi:RHS repeat-associated protein
MAITDSEMGQIEQNRYTAYGKRVLDYGDSSGRSIIGLTTGFTGRALDEETGLMYYRNRMYAPQTGTFVSRDQLGYVDGQSLYRAYFAPNKMDPLGNMTFEQVRLVMNKLDRCAQAYCELNLDAGRNYLISSLVSGGKPGLDYLTMLKDVKEGIEKVKSGIGAVGDAAGQVKTLSEILEIVAKIKANEGEQSDLEELQRRLKGLESKLGAAANGIGEVVDSIEIFGGLGSEATATDQVNGLAAIMSLGGTFSGVPVVGSILGSYEKSIRAIASYMDTISNATIAKDLVIFDGMDCASLNKMTSIHQDSKKWWLGLAAALNIKKPPEQPPE